jgi:hypothetical protein
VSAGASKERATDEELARVSGNVRTIVTNAQAVGCLYAYGAGNTTGALAYADVITIVDALDSLRERIAASAVVQLEGIEHRAKAMLEQFARGGEE